jgi:nodulation protein E
MREVWITGTGAVSAAGIGAPALARLFAGGESAIHNAGGSWRGAAPMEAHGKEARRLDRGARLFLAAAREAWGTSGLAAGPDRDPRRTGVIEGSSVGTMGALLDEARSQEPDGERRARRLVRFMPGAGGATFAQEHAIGGPVLYLSAGSISASLAIGEAFFMIAMGRLDIAVTGGGEAPLHDDIMATFRAAGILSQDAEWPCRPFDARRSGTVLGEGGGAVVLEAADHARRRGAEPFAVLRGYATVTEPSGMVAPDANGAGVACAVRESTAMAGGRRPAWIKAHGTGTKANDLAECRGLWTAFGSELAAIPITSLKSTFGHALGGSGALELVAALTAMREGILPATIGTSRPDPDLPRCDIVTESRDVDASDILLLSESFGGRSAALVVGAA